MSTEKLFQELGLPEDLATSLNEENLSEAKEKILSTIKSKLLEDETFYTEIPKERLPREYFNEKFNEGVNKVAALGKGAIDKHFGITAEDKKSFEEGELKDIAKYVAKAASIYKSKIAEGSKDVNALQDENLSLKQLLEDKDSQIKTIQEKFESEFSEKLTAKESEWLAKAEALSLQQNIPVSVGLVFDKVYDVIKSKYSVVIEGGQAQIRKKDNPAFKVTKDGSKEYMTLKDALVSEFQSLGAWKEEQKPAASNTITVQVQPNKGAAMTDAIKKKILEEEAFFGNS